MKCQTIRSWIGLSHCRRLSTRFVIRSSRSHCGDGAVALASLLIVVLPVDRRLHRLARYVWAILAVRGIRSPQPAQ